MQAREGEGAWLHAVVVPAGGRPGDRIQMKKFGPLKHPLKSPFTSQINSSLIKELFEDFSKDQIFDLNRAIVPLLSSPRTFTCSRVASAGGPSPRRSLI